MAPITPFADRQFSEVATEPPEAEQLQFSFVPPADTKPPQVSGQCGQVLDLIRKHQPIILSLEQTGNHSIPETAARVHDLRGMVFNIITTIRATVLFRGQIRRKVALYSLGVPEWVPPFGRAC